jgi:hypothetical protein
MALLFKAIALRAFKLLLCLKGQMNEDYKNMTMHYLFSKIKLDLRVLIREILEKNAR